MEELDDENELWDSEDKLKDELEDELKLLGSEEDDELNELLLNF